MVTVYYYESFDMSAGDMKRSQRRATKDAIEKRGHSPMLDTAVEVDERELDENGFVKAPESAKPPKGK
jgi:hypothetical protein